MRVSSTPVNSIEFPITRNLFSLPWRFEMSGVECNLIDQELKIKKKKKRMLWTGKTIPRVSVKKYGISYLPYPGKNIKWDPADPTWDYGTSRMGSCQLGFLLKFLIASRQSHLGSQVCPRWDPTWDYGTSCLKFLIASHLRKHIPGGIKPRIPPIPLGILPQISDSFPPGKSYPRRDCTWDPANPSLDPA